MAANGTRYAASRGENRSTARRSTLTGKAGRVTLLLVLSAASILLADWFLVAATLGRTCALLYEGGNITQCVGGLSEEEMIGSSGLIALLLLVIQIGLIVLALRRAHPNS